MSCNLLLVNGIKKLSLFQIFAFGKSKVESRKSKCIMQIIRARGHDPSCRYGPPYYSDSTLSSPN